MEETEKKTISLGDVANIKEAMDIQSIRHCKHLEEWEKAESEIKPMYKDILEQARLDLVDYWNSWNEEELKMKFISIVMRTAEIEIPDKARVFYERPLSGQLEGYDFSVICDCMLASPTAGGRPKKPYFFLQEFKKEKAEQTDPEAQMLVAMLLAQEQNQDQKVVYGAWVRGENWHFSTLQGKEYCISRSYVATLPIDLSKIVAMMQYLKTLILGR